MSDLVLVPRKATDEMSEAAFEAAGTPADWCGFDEMWEAAIAAWENAQKADS